MSGDGRRRFDLGDVEVLVNNAGIARRDQDAQEKMLAQVPLGGMGEPEHIAALALHLCSDEAAYTTASW